MATHLKAAGGHSSRIGLCSWTGLFFAGLIALLAAGCQSSRPKYDEAVAANAIAPMITVLREGDVIGVSFPGAPKLNQASQQIRADGIITLPLVGDVKAAGKTPSELEKSLIDLYTPLLVNPRIAVTVVSSSFDVYVNGAVLHQGKVTTTHPMTALQAVMEAGGPDYAKANLEKVRLTRQQGTNSVNFQLNLKKQMDGQEPPFYLKPADIIFVPEKFNPFG
jgi:polysaccharide export outer membrane protein